MDLNLAGKKALVTGASAGLGAATALELASEGVKLFINSRSEEKLTETAEAIFDATGNKPELLIGDLSNENDLNAICDKIKTIEPDILISNTGGPPSGLFTEIDLTEWDKAKDSLLRPAVALTRAVIDSMIKKKFGRLLYITSIAVLQPVDTLILSNSYRAAITGFCKTVSNTYAKHGITANCLCPGYTETERLISLAEKIAEHEKVSVNDIKARFAESTAVKRIGQPEELASMAVFLASERASYITGSSIAIDGGAYKGIV